MIGALVVALAIVGFWYFVLRKAKAGKATFTWHKPGWIDGATAGPFTQFAERQGCEDLCAADSEVPDCKAYTWGRGATGNGTCYLYDHVLDTEGGFRVASEFWGAGIRQ
jgi:hypothetical protein